MFNRCEGLPNGACPDNRQDKTVKNTIYDLFLCPSCEKSREAEKSTASAEFKECSKKASRQPAKKSTAGNIGSLSGDSVVGHSTDRTSRAKESTSSVTETANPHVSQTRDTTGKKKIDSGSVDLNPSSAGAQSQTTSGPPDDHSCGPQFSTIIVDELLAYTVFYRDRCTSADLHRLIGHFYLPIEISASKATILRLFETHLVDCQFTTSRRHTSTRSAHEAEIDDILGVLELLDNLNVLCLVQFAAVSIDRLPKYGPNEINVCTVVDRQQQIDKELNDLKETLLISATNSNSSSDKFFTAASDKLFEAVNSKLNLATDKFNGQLRQLEAMCQNLSAMTSSACNTTSRQGSSASTIPPVDRAANIIVFGLGEDRNSSVWNSVLSKVLLHVAGRPVEIADAFRIGKFNPSQARHRPVIVKLRCAWDKRLLLSNARKLSEVAEFRRIGIASDEPLETRRKITMKRLQHKATLDGKQVSVSADGDCLQIDNVVVFSLKDGFICTSSSPNHYNNG
jgi:hypothetical protein